MEQGAWGMLYGIWNNKKRKTHTKQSIEMPLANKTLPTPKRAVVPHGKKVKRGFVEIEIGR